MIKGIVRFPEILCALNGILMYQRVRQTLGGARYLTVVRIFLGLMVFLSACSAAFPNGSETNVALQGFVPVTTSAVELPEKFGLSDNHFYVQTGLDLADGGSLSTDSQFSLRQWAPGTSFLVAGIVKIFGPSVSLGIIWGLFSAVLWTVVFLTLVCASKSNLGVIFLGASFIFLFQSTPFVDWFFSSGYFYSESISIAFGILAMLSLGFKRQDLRVGFLTGTFLALAAFFKGTYEFVGLVFTLFTMVYLVTSYIVRKFPSKRIEFLVPPNRHLKRISFTVIVFHLYTFPWRIWSDLNLYPSSFTLDWTAHTSQYWGHRWMPTDWLEKVGSSWFSINGGNSACILDLQKCKEVAELELPSGGNFSGGGHYSQHDFMRMSLETFLLHPFDWISSRIPFFQNAWFPSDADSSVQIWGIIFLLSTLFITILAVQKLLVPKSVFLNFSESVIYISIALGTLLPLLLQQIEPRYLYPLQILSLVICFRFCGVQIDKFISKDFLKAENTLI
jgi:hypothetical protein